MKLQNENTGQVENFCIDKDQICSCDRAFVYDSLEQLQDAGWKDYKEPKDDYIRVIKSFIHYVEEADDSFCCDKTVQKFVEKLKAWQRLKENGFEFTGWKRDEKYCGDFTITATDQTSCDDEDLDLLFNEKEYLRKEVQKIVEKNADYYDRFGGGE